MVSRKNNKGFTLIELLVVIALMLSILGIAIVSFINVNNRKKEEAWKQTKEQIETAALEYFNSNEYLFEGMSDTAIGKIYLKKLIEDDYLNKVTNPITGNTISSCSVINVSKNKNKYSVSFDEDTINNKEDCALSVEIKDEKPTDFTIVFKNENGEVVKPNGDGWFNIEKLGESNEYNIFNKLKYKKLRMYIVPNLENGDVKQVTVNEKIVTLKNDNYEYVIEKDCINQLNVEVINEHDKISKKIVDVKKDTIRPTLAHQFSYKIFNIVSAGTTEEISQNYNKHGVKVGVGGKINIGSITLTLGNSAVISWDNVQGFDNINKIELAFPVGQLGNVRSVDFRVKNNYGDYSIPPSCGIACLLSDYTNSGLVEHTLSNGTKQKVKTVSWANGKKLNGFYFQFNCTSGTNCVKTVEKLNSTGISIYTAKSTDMNASDLKSNYKNYIRMQLYPSDELSGISKNIIYKKTSDSTWEELKIENLSFTYGNKQISGYCEEGEYQFKVTDDASNESAILTVNTIGKFE